MTIRRTLYALLLILLSLPLRTAGQTIGGTGQVFEGTENDRKSYGFTRLASHVTDAANLRTECFVGVDDKIWTWASTKCGSRAQVAGIARIGEEFNPGYTGLPQGLSYYNVSCSAVPYAQCVATSPHLPTPSQQTPCGSSDGCRPDQSPIFIDLGNNGLHLTDVDHGVAFDINADGVIDQVAWMDKHASDPLLVLDRNGDGLINSGAELFGSATPQPAIADPNGFHALLQWDLPENGGNADGIVSPADRIWRRLQLWSDANHDGLSEPAELSGLDSSGLFAINLTYRVVDRRDGHGNLLQLQSWGVLNSGWSVPIIDVYLLSTADDTAGQLTANRVPTISGGEDGDPEPGPPTPSLDDCIENRTTCMITNCSDSPCRACEAEYRGCIDDWFAGL